MSTTRTPEIMRPERSKPTAVQRGYFWLSTRPLHVLAFLAPVVIAAELGTFALGSDSIATQLAAHRMLVRFFETFGVLGLHVPAMAIVVVLFVQHMISKDRWRIEPIVPAAMLVESAFLTGPLLILVLLLQPGAAPAAAAFAADDPAIGGSSGILLALGAGLYEEVLFRLVVITAIHFVAADLIRLPERAARVIAVVVSAVLFAMHHDVATMGGGINWKLASFYFLAGVYFGVLFLARGLGIAVGVHALYDLLVIVVMPGFSSAEGA